MPETGDGIMAAFDDVASALECSTAIQAGFSFDAGRDVVLKGISGPTRVFELAPREP